MIAKRIDELLGNTMKGLGRADVSAREKRENELHAVVGDDWAGRVRVLSYERGTLLLGTDSSAVLQEIRQFHGEAWLTALQEAGSPVKKIRTSLVDESEMER